MNCVKKRFSYTLMGMVDRTETRLQQIVDDAPQAAFYFSDLFATYRNLIYKPGHYTGG